MFIRFTRHGIRRDMHRSFQSPMMEQVSPVQTGNKPVSPVQMNKIPEPISPVETGTNPNLAAYARRPRFYRGRR